MWQPQEFTGRTVDEAIHNALKSLNKKLGEVDITVLSLGKPGILGVGGEEARIKISPKLPDIGQLAKKTLEMLLSKMKFPATVNLFASTPALGSGVGRITLNVTDTDASRLIGRQGQTLRALEFILNSILSHQLKSRVKVFLDVEGYRKKRYRSLRNLALRLAEQVKSTEKPITTEPLYPDERRIIHLTLARDREVAAKTIGEREERRIVIEKISRSEQPPPKT